LGGLVEHGLDGLSGVGHAPPLGVLGDYAVLGLGEADRHASLWHSRARARAGINITLGLPGPPRPAHPGISGLLCKGRGLWARRAGLRVGGLGGAGAGRGGDGRALRVEPPQLVLDRARPGTAPPPPPAPYLPVPPPARAHPHRPRPLLPCPPAAPPAPASPG